MNNQMDNRPDRNRPNRNNPGNQGPNKNRQSILAFLICLLISLVCLSFVTDMMSDSSSEITYDKFIEMVDKDQVKEVTLQSGVLTVVPKIQKSYYQNASYKVNQMEDADALTKRLEGTDIVFHYEQPDAMGEFVSTMISVLLPTVVLFFMLFTGNLLISSFTDNTADSFLALFASPMFWLSLLSLFVSFFLVFSAFFGEEYGWRYFLQPILQEHFGMRKGVLILGVFWGLWHLPLNLFYYAPDTRLQSIAAQLITCIALSVFFAFAYMKTDNIWIPVILHFMNNNIAGLISGGTVSGAVIEWKAVLIHLIFYSIFFLPFLASKVFRESETEKK